MMTFALLPVVTTLAAILLVTVLAIASVRGYEPATAAPFAPGSVDPSADTLAGSSELVRTVLNPLTTPATDWQVATLANLCEVEDLLDSLEAHGVCDREVTTLAADCFAVRWR